MSITGHSTPGITERKIYLLVPVKKAEDAVHGASYAKHLVIAGRSVKINLLHVMEAGHESLSLFSFFKTGRHPDETSARTVLKDAATYLVGCHLPHSTYLLSGNVALSILDAAELLDCTTIVLPVEKPGSWRRLFSRSIVSKVAQSARGVPVVIVDSNGVIYGSADHPRSHGNFPSSI